VNRAEYDAACRKAPSPFRSLNPVEEEAVVLLDGLLASTAGLMLEECVDRVRARYGAALSTGFYEYLLGLEPRREPPVGPGPRWPLYVPSGVGMSTD
jgi:hypothetical protein